MFFPSPVKFDKTELP